MHELLASGLMMPRGIMGQPNVVWIEMTGRDMEDAFFENALQRALLSGARVVQTDPDALRMASGLRPNGFLFHMSRCGSTLIMNMLRQSPKVIAVSEPSIVPFVIASAWKERPSYAAALLGGAMSALGQKRTGAEEFFVCKFSSAECVFLPQISSAFPDVPCVFLYRDPVEVLVSNMKHPHQTWIYMLPTYDISETELTETHTPLENCAIALRRKCETVIENADRIDRFLNYSELSAEVFKELLDILGIQVSDADLGRMISEKSRNAKNRGQAFAPDGNEKAAKASKTLRAVADEYLADVYARLEALRIGKSASS
jgi:hypothetical protein